MMKLLAKLFVDWPARFRPFEQWIEKLQVAGNFLQTKVEAMPDTVDNQETIRHIIGIERWGQQRLRTALGDVIVVNEYDSLRPSDDLDWSELKESFKETRHMTIELAKQIDAKQAVKKQAPHNQFGNLSMHGWLSYLDMHANLEAKNLKG